MNFPTTNCEIAVVHQLRLMGIIVPNKELVDVVTVNCRWAQPSIISNFIFRCFIWKMTLEKLKKEKLILTKEELIELERIVHHESKQFFVEYIQIIRSRIKKEVLKNDEPPKIDINPFRIRNSWEELLAQINKSGKLDEYSENEIFTDFVVSSFSVEQAEAHASELRSSLSRRKPEA